MRLLRRESLDMSSNPLQRHTSKHFKADKVVFQTSSINMEFTFLVLVRQKLKRKLPMSNFFLELNAFGLFTRRDLLGPESLKLVK